MPTAEPQKITIPDGEPGADLPALLDPWLWLAEVTPVRTYHKGTGTPERVWLEMLGTAKLTDVSSLMSTPTTQKSAYIRAQNFRESLTYRAETAITAVESAGYLHERHPQITITGDLTHGRDGKPDELRAEATVRMTLTRPEWQRKR